jgi:two-component system, LytTR family, response regulator
MHDETFFTVAIVDDEPLARKRIRDLLRDHSELRIVAEAGTVREAVEVIEREHPDVLFLDVQLSDGTGFDVLGDLKEPFSGVTVFVTAYDQHAVRAFDVHAVDYLLKPLKAERFEQTIARAKEMLLAGGAGRMSRLTELLTGLRKETGVGSQPRRLAITLEDDRVILLQVAEIDWIESAGNYVRLHVGAASHLFRESLTALETRLDPGQFVRIHRSTIVNLDRVRELEPNAYGDYVVHLEGGARLGLSRRYRERISLLLGRL